MLPNCTESPFNSLAEIDTVWCQLVNVFYVKDGVRTKHQCQNENKVCCHCNTNLCGI